MVTFEIARIDHWHLFSSGSVLSIVDARGCGCEDARVWLHIHSHNSNIGACLFIRLEK
jgi:hypothetical protein